MSDTQDQAGARYKRVKHILNEAQGDNIPDYQGYRAFWLLPIGDLLKVKIYGQLMIAPGDDEGHERSQGGSGGGCSHCGPSSSDSAGESIRASEVSEKEIGPDCWPSSGQGGGRKPPGGNKRSDRSGLIKGLRGQYPFDGTVFPPLLWNAAHKVSVEDIGFIADWIDDGLPTRDADEAESLAPPARVTVKTNELLALACGDKPHACSGKHINSSRDEVTGLRVRKEAGCLTDEELQPLRDALACMYQYNDFWLDERSFNFWARIHTNSCQHGWEQFLPWHRLYLYFFEQKLQDYDERITLPYWNWTAYSDVNADTSQTDKGIIPEAYRCWINQRGIDRLRKTGLLSEEELDGLESIKGNKQFGNSGLRFLQAAGIDYSLDTSSDPITRSSKINAIYDELLRINPLWWANRWPGGTGIHYPTPDDVEAILSVKSFADFGSGPPDDHHYGALEEVHNGMHLFAGGVNPNFPPPGVENPDKQNVQNPPNGWMFDNRTTAFDPIFWAHHANVDRLWAVWQTRNPGVNPEEVDGILAPWSLSVRDSLSTKKLGYEYCRDSYHFPTSNNVAITRFSSEKPGVLPDVLETCNKAEVRLHRVQRGNLPSFNIRVFLNDPAVTAETSMENNDHFVGQVSTFHGSCYGGPGHCELPSPRTRRFDRRPLHHHEPRNFRIDATAAVRRMIAKGEEDISVHAVVVGVDGKPLDDALYVDGISLNFMD